MTGAEPNRARRPHRPPPQLDERTGGGTWLLVAACILVGAGVVLFLWERMVQGTRLEQPAGMPAAVAAAPTPEAEVALPAPGDRPPPPPGEGEGRVTITPREGLRVLWAAPKRGTLVYPHEVLTVQFSSPLDPASLGNALVISQPLAGSVEWPRQDQMIYRPGRPLEMGATYKVVLNGYAQDLSHQEYLQPHEWSFEVYKDYSFTHNVGGLLRHACGECHSPGRSAPRVLLDSYGRVMPYVKKGNSAASPLLAALENPSIHGQIGPEAQRLLYVVRDWIDRFEAAE